MTASNTARQRRKQHAPTRTKPGVRGNAKRGEPSRTPRARGRRGAASRRTASASKIGSRRGTKLGIITRIRDRVAARSWFSSEHGATPSTHEIAVDTRVEPDQPREWPRRLGIAALKFGSAVAVAWALLIAGREVYEYATTSSRFEVQHFIYAPTNHVDDEQLRSLLAIAPGTNILACDLPELSERIAAHPWVAQATVIRNLPDTLEVQVVEHTPEAIVLAERFYLVNSEGQPFKPVARGERGKLPVITGIERAQLADERDTAVAQVNHALELIRLYNTKQRPRLGEIHLDNDGSITLYTAEAGTALRLGREDFAARLERWDALRAALGDRADRLAIVHLDHGSKPDRRDRVVARFANERDEAVLLAHAASGQDTDQDPSEVASQPAQEHLPARAAGQRNRIPRYE